MAAVLRWLFWFSSFVTVLVAIATSTGRMLMPWLDDLEPQLNRLLEARGIELRGFQGDWRGLNPIFRADGVRFNGGLARDVEFELDLLESALNSALVARRIEVASLELALVHNEEGLWQLGGKPLQGLPFSVDQLLRESDAISVPAARVRFYTTDSESSDTRVEAEVDAEAPEHDPLRLLGDFSAELETRNRDRVHAGRLAVGSNTDNCSRCGVNLAYHVGQGLAGDYSEGSARVEVENLVVGAELGVALGALGGTIEALSGRWHIVEGMGRGSLSVSARDMTLATGVLGHLALDARVVAVDEHRHWRAELTRLVVQTPGAEGLELAGVLVEGDLRPGRPTMSARLGEVDLASTSAALRSALGGIAAVEMWLGALQPQGTITGLELRMGPGKGQIGYHAALQDLSLEHFKGVPKVRRANASLVGFENGIRISLNERDVLLGFRDVFDHDSEFTSARGSVEIWFERGYVGIRGRDIEFQTGETVGTGSFVLSRPTDRYEQRLGIFTDLQDMSVATAQQYVPNKLSRALIAWIGDAMRGGQIDRARVAYYGHLRVRPGWVMRHADVLGDVSGATVRYHPDWPDAQGVDGSVHVSLGGTEVEVASGDLIGIRLENTRVFVPRSGEFARIQGLGRGPGEAALRFVRETPIREWLPQVNDSWVAEGELAFGADLRVPLKADESLLAIELDTDLLDLTLTMGDLGVSLQNLGGELRYLHPFIVSGQRIDGAMFDRPARFTAETVEGEVRFGVGGRVSVAEVEDWLELGDAGLAEGEFDFDAVLRLPPDEGAVQLDVSSELTGVTINVPPPFAKPSDAPLTTRLSVTFEERFTGLSFDLSETSEGWVHFKDDATLGGFVRIGGDSAWIPPQQAPRDELMVVGRIDNADLSRWSDLLPLIEDQGGNQRWSVPGFEVEHAYFGDVVFDSLLVDAWGTEDGLRVAVDSPQIKGVLEQEGQGVMQLDVEYIVFPGSEDDESDPLEGLDLSQVPDLNVSIREILVDESSYGSWEMELRRTADGFSVDHLSADVKGLHIESSAPGTWTSEGDNRSHFIGTVSATDLAKVMPQWDYAASVESTTAGLQADLNWPGSPLNFDLWYASGVMDIDISTGRFLEVQSGSGTARIFGLLNLAALAKRITLDFSDLFGRGISFDEVTAQADLVDGFLTFVEPMTVKGSGGSFQLAGTVDLKSGDLDNEMVVTLPVSDSLPWYAAYLGVFANPIIGGAVFFGERLFRDQIDNFSSAKYKIAGNLDDPEVTFVQVFSNTMDGSSAQAEPDAEDATQLTDTVSDS